MFFFGVDQKPASRSLQRSHTAKNVHSVCGSTPRHARARQSIDCPLEKAPIHGNCRSCYAVDETSNPNYTLIPATAGTRGISLDGHHGIQLLLWPPREFGHVDIRPSGVLELRCLLLHRLHRGALPWGGSLRDLHSLHRHGTAAGWENAMTPTRGNGAANLEPRSG